MFEIVIFQIFNCLRHVYSLIRFGRPRHLEIHSDLKKFIAKLTRYLLVFAYSPSPWSFNILNIDVDHLICHIQRASKSDVQLKRHFDLNISPGQIPKLIVEFSSVIRQSVIRWFFSNVLIPPQTQEKNILLSVFGSLLATEDVELLCHLYKDFTGGSFSHSKLEIVKKRFPKEVLKKKRPSRMLDHFSI